MPPIAPVTSLVFIDAAVADYQSLIEGLAPGSEAIVLDSAQDGVEQITATLASRSDIQSVHIVSHGSPGSLQLGATQLSLDTLDRYTNHLRLWWNHQTGASKNQEPDATPYCLQIYGCNVAAGDAGAEFIAKLHQLTGAAIAASRFPVGNKLLGGTWQLEVTLGQRAEAPFHAMTLSQYTGLLPTVNLPQNLTGAGATWDLNNSGGINVGDGNFFNGTVTQGDTFDGGLYLAVNGTRFTPSNIVDVTGSTLTTGTVAMSGLDVSLQHYADQTRPYLRTFASFNNPTGSPITVALTWDTNLGSDGSGTVVETSSGDTNLDTSDRWFVTDDNPTAGDPALTFVLVGPGSPSISAYSSITQPSSGNTTVQFSSVTIPANSTRNFLFFTGMQDTSANAQAAAPLFDSYPSLSASGLLTGLTATQLDNTLNFQFGLPANTAPTLIDKVVTLTTVNEDAGTPTGAVGTLISTLVDLNPPVGGLDNVTDPETGAVTGVAITTTDTSNGTWHYSTDNGTNWTLLGAVSDTSARLLAADASTRVYFQPNANYNGSIATAITFRAWDTTTGTNGSTADTSTNGGGTAFSTATDTAAIAVSPVNDAPTLTTGSNLIYRTSMDGNSPFESYNPVTNTWSTLGTVNTTAQLASGADGSIYMLNATTNMIQRYAPATNTWVDVLTGPPGGANYGNLEVTNSGEFVVTEESSTLQYTLGGVWQTLTLPGTAWALGDYEPSTNTLVIGERDSSTVWRVNLGTQAITSFNGTGGASEIRRFGEIYNGFWYSRTFSGPITRFDLSNNSLPLQTVGGTPTTGNWSSSALNEATGIFYLSGFNSTAFEQWNPVTNIFTTLAAAPTAGLHNTMAYDAGGLVPISLTPLNEDPLTNTGDLLSTLLGSKINDADGGALKGIAVTAVDDTNGTWQFSIDNGGTWTSFGTPSNSVARLLQLDANNRVRFVPNPNYNGTVTNGLTLRAWDTTSGTNGDTADTSINGSSTAFSATTATASIAINPANDAPVLIDKVVALTTINEDAIAPVGAVGTLISTLVDLDPPISGLDNVTDTDSGAVTGIAITTADTTNGTWFYSTDNGTAWTALGVVTNANARLLAADASTRVYFQPNANYNGTLPTALTFRAWDTTTGTNGGTADTSTNGTTTAFSTATDTAAIAITPVNDAPILTGSATLTAINEDILDAANTGTKVSALINGLTTTDIDGDPKAIAITGVDNTKGVWQYSTDGGTIWTNFSATPSDSTATILGATSFYQANLGTDPTAQGQLSFTNLNLITPAQLGTQTFDSSGTILNTDVDSNIYAGYSNFSGAAPVNPPLPKLDNVEGYSVSFNLELLTESHTNPNRAGFSIIVVSSDKTKAIELGFQDGNIFAQQDAGFTAGENATFNTKQSIDYRLEVLGNSYNLFANSTSILTGALRDYSAFNGAIDPYETPNLIFLGDDSTSAQGSFNLSQVVVQTDNRVRFVPNANANGNSTINFRAWDTTDGGASGAIVNASVNGGITSYSAATGTASIAINAVNDAPTATDDTATVAEDSAVTSINVLSNDSFAPDTGETLSVSAVGIPSNGGTATINGTAINYTPAANFNGTETFSYTLSDGNGGTDTATATITVTPVNDAPTATDDTATVAEDSAVTSINVLSNDSFAPDTGETLSVSVVGIPSNGGTATINGTAINYTPAANFNGTETFSYTLSDGNGGTDTATATITVTPVNDAPTATDDTATVAEDSTVTSINVLSNDSFAPDTGETLTITAVGTTSNGGTAVINGTTIDYTPAANFNGTETFSYTLSDGNGGTDTATATITVTPVNDAPTATDDTATVAEDSAVTSINVLSNDSFAPDTGETLSVSVVGIPSNGGTATINGTAINYTPAANFNGTETFSYTLSDGNGGTDTATATITVTPVNDDPTISGTPGTTIAEDSPYSFIPTAADVDLGGTLTFSITGKPTWAAFNITTGELGGTAVNGDVGTTTGIVISVSDGGTPINLPAFNLTVTNINDLPTVTNAIADQAATEASFFTFAVPANSFTDIDTGDILTYTATLANGNALPNWLTFNPTNQTFSGTPAAADIGSLDIKVTARDIANAMAEDTFSLTVANFNDAPTVANAIVDQSATEDTLFTLAVSPNTFSDLDVGDILTYTATQADDTPLPSWLTFNATTQTFSGTPLNAQVGSLNVKLKATDTGLLTAEDIFTVTIANTNDAPTLTNAIVDPSATEDAPFTFTIPANTFTDVDAGNTLTYTATLANNSSLPTWLTFNPTTRTFSGTPRNANVGNLDLKVKATDGAGAIAEDVFTVKVANINQPPVTGTPITPVPQQVTATQPFSLKIPTGAFTDPDAGDTLTFSASLESGAPLPPWLILDAKTGAFSGIPDIFSVGNLSLKVNATDAQGSKTSQTLRLAIANPTGITGTPTSLINFSNGKKGVTLKAKKGQLLRGTSRRDVLKGTKGNDRIKASSGKDSLQGGRGNDFIQAGKGRDLLLGGDGNDRLLGSNGDDILIGGNGADTLAGGKSRDMFAFANVNEGKDAIADFSPTEDVIDLRSLFAQPQFAGATPYVRYLKYVQMTQVGTSTEIKIDADGSGVGNTFTTLATLNNIGIGAMGSRHFVIS